MQRERESSERLADADGGGPREGRRDDGEVRGVPQEERRPEDGAAVPGRDGEDGPWDDSYLIPCSDGTARRVGRGVFPLAPRIPSRVEPIVAELQRLGHGPADVKRFKRKARELLARARKNRVVRLKGSGNAIVPFLGAQFILACEEARVEAVNRN